MGKLKKFESWQVEFISICSEEEIKVSRLKAMEYLLDCFRRNLDSSTEVSNQEQYNPSRGKIVDEE